MSQINTFILSQTVGFKAEGVEFERCERLPGGENQVELWES